MSQERLKVLELLSTGKINAEQAAELLQNLGRAAKPPAPPPPPLPSEREAEAKVASTPSTDFADELETLKASVASPQPDPPTDEPDPPPTDDGPTAKPPQKLRIRVVDNTGKQRVDLGIPFKLLKFGVSIGERFAPEMGAWDWGNLDIDVEDGDGHVHIFVE